MAEDRRIAERKPVTYENYPIEAINDLREKQAEVDALKEQVNALAKSAEQTALAKVDAPVDVALPVMSLDLLRERDDFIKGVIDHFFVEGIHFGVPFPGSKDKMLYKVGAEWFAQSFGVRPLYVPLEVITERGDTPRVFFRYRCDLVFFRTGQVVGSAEGICSSDEDKYKYRIAKYKCPSCKQETIGPDRFSKNGGWVCYKKSGGCGAKYAKGEASIENQPTPGRTLNTEVLNDAHTICAMAQKRAFVLALKGAYGLGAYIKYFEGLDDVADEEPNGTVINGTATVKPDVPASVQKFNEQVRAETEQEATAASEAPTDSAEQGEPDENGQFTPEQRKQFYLSIANMIEHGSFTKEDFVEAFDLSKFDDHVLLEKARQEGKAQNVGQALTWVRKTLNEWKSQQPAQV